MRWIGLALLCWILGFPIAGKLARYLTWINVPKRYWLSVFLTTMSLSVFEICRPALLVSMSIGFFRRMRLAQIFFFQLVLQACFLVRWRVNHMIMSWLSILMDTMEMIVNLHWLPGLWGWNACMSLKQLRQCRWAAGLLRILTMFVIITSRKPRGPHRTDFRLVHKQFFGQSPFHFELCDAWEASFPFDDVWRSIGDVSKAPACHLAHVNEPPTVTQAKLAPEKSCSKAFEAELL